MLGRHFDAMLRWRGKVIDQRDEPSINTWQLPTRVPKTLALTHNASAHVELVCCVKSRIAPSRSSRSGLYECEFSVKTLGATDEHNAMLNVWKSKVALTPAIATSSDLLLSPRLMRGAQYCAQSRDMRFMPPQKARLAGLKETADPMAACRESLLEERGKDGSIG